MNPASMIRLPLHFSDRLKSRNLEADFLAVDVPAAYNIILGRPTLYKVKRLSTHCTCSNFNLKVMMEAYE